MFGLFKSDTSKKLRKEYDALLEQAMLAQRKGDIELYSTLTEKSEQIWAQIEDLKKRK